MLDHAESSNRCVDGDVDLVLTLGPLKDETALVIYEFLESICEKFGERYARQIQRADCARKRDERRRRRERKSLPGAQQPLALG